MLRHKGQKSKLEYIDNDVFQVIAKYLEVDGKPCVMEMIEKIDAGTAIRLLDAGKAVAVDVREPDEYAVGHIPGAKLLPLGEVNSRAAEVLPEKEATWLVYCRTGRRSAEAVQKLDALGYSNLYDLGGILSWPYEIEGDFEGHF